MDLKPEDIIIHCAFARKSRGDLLVRSFEYTREVVNKSIRGHIRGFVNISSQSVYGNYADRPWTEQDELNPEYLYAIAKAASEELVMGMATEAITHFRM